MKLPTVGELNKRVTITKIHHKPESDDWGFEPETLDEFTVYGALRPVGSMTYYAGVQINAAVTHQVFVRRVKGRTAPEDVQQVTQLKIGGMTFQVERVSDVGGLERFTVFDVRAI